MQSLRQPASSGHCAGAGAGARGTTRERRGPLKDSTVELALHAGLTTGRAARPPWLHGSGKEATGKLVRASGPRWWVEQRGEQVEGVEEGGGDALAGMATLRWVAASAHLPRAHSLRLHSTRARTGRCPELTLLCRVPRPRPEAGM